MKGERTVTKTHKLCIIGVPMDLGAGRRGVDMGPSAIRYAGLHDKLRKIGWTVEDHGNLPVPVAESKPSATSHLKYLREVLAVTSELDRVVTESLRGGQLPLVLGGDHSIAMGSLAGVSRVLQRPAVLWFDAHGDLNTDRTSPSGNIHGMPLAASLGIGAPELLAGRGDAPAIDARRVALIGVRTLDPGEKELIRDAKIACYTMTEVDKYGMREVVHRALEQVMADADGLHLSFDLDALSPDEAPGVGTPYRGGLTYREAHLALEMIAEAKVVRSLEMVEVNPILDRANRTAELAAELIASALGQRIL